LEYIKSETRSTKSETNPNPEFSILKTAGYRYGRLPVRPVTGTAGYRYGRLPVLVICILVFGFVSDFDIRIWDFPMKWDPSVGVISAMGPEPIGHLLDAHAAALTLYARQWCGTPEDVVQEAFLKLAALPAAPPHAVAWLYTVVRRAAISAARSATRRRKHEARAAARAAAWFVPAEPPGLDAAAAQSALADLPLDQREAIVAHLWGGLTFEQVGDLTGSSPATAYRRYAAGLAALRAQLGVPCPNRNSPPT
jgi:RNA polymerase sigma-70 factor (ECF subfamily)